MKLNKTRLSVIMLILVSLLFSSCGVTFISSDISDKLDQSSKTQTVDPIPEIPDSATETELPVPEIPESEPETEAPLPDFWFSITWDASRSTYNSATGYLANDLHSTTLILTEEEMNSIKKLIEDADINSFADSYEGPKSKPSVVLNLEVSQNGVTKKINSNYFYWILDDADDYDEKLIEYVELCYNILLIIRDTDEYKNLPKGRLYL